MAQADVYLTAHLIGPSITVVVSDWLVCLSHCECGDLAAISEMIGWGRVRGSPVCFCFIYESIFPTTDT